MQHEYEISIRIPITQCEFEEIKQFGIRNTCVFFFSTYRISENQKQIKTTTEKKHRLKFIESQFLPYVYTESIETNIDGIVDFSNDTIESATLRIIIYEKCNIRISVDFSTNGKFIMIAEKEFDCPQTLTQLNDCNDDFFDLVVSKIRQHLPRVKYFTTPDSNIIIAELNNIPSKRFELLFNIGPPPYIIKAKFDGYKGKFIIHKSTNGDAIFIDTIMKIGYIKNLPSELIANYNHFILQYEQMSSNVILTDVVGVYINAMLYETHPCDVLKCFNNLPFTNHTITLDSIPYQLFKQRALPGFSLENIIPPDKADGFILIDGHQEYKYKIPTCDVRMLNNKLYIDNEKFTNSIDYRSYCKMRLENGIYEIHVPINAIFKKDTGTFNLPFKILRSRIDRDHTSTLKEFDDFIEASIFLSNLRE
jgi:hypothetical protein